MPVQFGLNVTSTCWTSSTLRVVDNSSVVNYLHSIFHSKVSASKVEHPTRKPELKTSKERFIISRPRITRTRYIIYPNVWIVVRSSGRACFTGACLWVKEWLLRVAAILLKSMVFIWCEFLAIFAAQVVRGMFWSTVASVQIHTVSWHIYEASRRIICASGHFSQRIFSELYAFAGPLSAKEKHVSVAEINLIPRVRSQVECLGSEWWSIRCKNHIHIPLTDQGSQLLQGCIPLLIFQLKNYLPSPLTSGSFTGGFCALILKLRGVFNSVLTPVLAWVNLKMDNFESSPI